MMNEAEGKALVVPDHGPCHHHETESQALEIPQLCPVCLCRGGACECWCWERKRRCRRLVAESSAFEIEKAHTLPIHTLLQHIQTHRTHNEHHYRLARLLQPQP